MNTTSVKDERISASLEIIKYNGLITKGIFNKEKYYNFITNVRVNNTNSLKLKEVRGFYFDKHGKMIPLKSELGKIAQLVSTHNINGNQIKVRFEITYKVGFGCTKTLVLTCNANLSYCDIMILSI